MKNKHKKIIIILLLTISITTGSLYIWQAVAAFEHGTTDKKIKDLWVLMKYKYKRYSTSDRKSRLATHSVPKLKVQMQGFRQRAMVASFYKV